MVDLKQLKDELLTNDVSFSYKDKDYVICPLDKFYVGEAGSENNQSFDTFEDMADKWLIDGKPLKYIINKIVLI